MAVVGAVCTVVAPVLGGTDIGGPWPFVIGFLVGVITGTGAALTVYGLATRGRQG
jgi:hypothetical protein